MGLLGWILYILLGFFYFIILQFLEVKYSISRLEKFVFSILLLMITSGIFYQWALNYTDNIFLVFVFLMIVDVIYNSYFVERDFFDREEGNVLYYICLFLAGFFVNQYFINQVNRVFLTGEDLRLILWSFMILFCYRFCKKQDIFARIPKTSGTGMSREMILTNYTKLKYQYYDTCDYGDKTLSNLVYAIMIFENHRRSKILRDYDYFVFRLKGDKRKLGIMQIESDKFISDVDSIELAFKKIDGLYRGKRGSKKSTPEEVLKKYCGEDASTVLTIFDTIKKF